MCINMFGVNFKKQNNIKEKAIGQEVLTKLKDKMKEQYGVTEYKY